MEPPVAAAAPGSLIEGVNQAAAALLGIRDLRHRSALPRIGPSTGVTLVETIHRVIADNHVRGGASASRDRSRENWRWSLQPRRSQHNASPEVVIERAIAAACVELGRDDWANQVPVASGLLGSPRDRRRAIDFVRRRGERHFELIELKVASDTPLHAAVEIIAHACLWLIARADRPSRPSLLLDERIRPAAMPDAETLLAHLDHPPRATALATEPTPVPAPVPASAPPFLPGIPEAHVLRRLRQAGGNEMTSGEFDNPDSSAALAVNALGWFIDRPHSLPPLPGTAMAGPAESVEIEVCARFPWSGGRHPWLDAAVLTATHLIGIESKRFEPFRDTKAPAFSAAYDRPVWGPRMQRFGLVRDALRSGTLRPRHLDAAQLVKHAYGLVTQARRLGRAPVLFYLFAEPAARAGRPIPPDDHARHRDEIADFAARVAGDEVLFASASYRDWLRGASGPAADHAAAVIERFSP